MSIHLYTAQNQIGCTRIRISSEFTEEVEKDHSLLSIGKAYFKFYKKETELRQRRTMLFEGYKDGGIEYSYFNRVVVINDSDEYDVETTEGNGYLKIPYSGYFQEYVVAPSGLNVYEDSFYSNVLNPNTIRLLKSLFSNVDEKKNAEIEFFGKIDGLYDFIEKYIEAFFANQLSFGKIHRALIVPFEDEAVIPSDDTRVLGYKQGSRWFWNKNPLQITLWDFFRSYLYIGDEKVYLGRMAMQTFGITSENSLCDYHGFFPIPENIRREIIPKKYLQIFDSVARTKYDIKKICECKEFIEWLTHSKTDGGRSMFEMIDDTLDRGPYMLELDFKVFMDLHGLDDKEFLNPIREKLRPRKITEKLPEQTDKSEVNTD